MKRSYKFAAFVFVLLLIVVVFVWAFVMPMIDSELDSGPHPCYYGFENLDVDREFACRSQDSISFRVNRGLEDFDLVDLEIRVFGLNGSSQSVFLLDAGYSYGDLPDSGEVKTYVIDKSYFDSIENYDELAIAPVVSFGPVERSFCDYMTAVVLEDC
jgi:hypothetical protein